MTGRDAFVMVSGVVGQRISETVSTVDVPPPVTDAVYTVGAALIAWGVSVLLNWLTKVLKRG